MFERYTGRINPTSKAAGMGNHEEANMGIDDPRKSITQTTQACRARWGQMNMKHPSKPLYCNENFWICMFITAFLFLGIGYGWRFAQDSKREKIAYQSGIADGDITFVKRLMTMKDKTANLRHFIYVNGVRSGYEINVSKWDNGSIHLKPLEIQ